MQFLNKATGTEFTTFTAKEIALFAIEGVDVWTTGPAWRRINKRARKMGLTINGRVTIDAVTSMAIDILVEEADKDLAAEVDFFIEEMMIMGFLEEEGDDDIDD